MLIKGYDGYLLTFSVDSDGDNITWIDNTSYVLLTVAQNPCVRSISDDYVLIAYDSTGEGAVVEVWEIDSSTGSIVGVVDSETLGLSTWSDPILFQIDSENWLVVYQNAARTAIYGTTFGVSSSTGSIGSAHDTHTIISGITDSFCVHAMTSSSFLCQYIKTDSYGYLLSFIVNPSTYIISTVESNIATGKKLKSTNYPINSICEIEAGYYLLAARQFDSPPKTHLITISCNDDGTSITVINTTPFAQYENSTTQRNLTKLADNLILLTHGTTAVTPTETLDVQNDGTCTQLDYSISPGSSLGSNIGENVAIGDGVFVIVGYYQSSPYQPRATTFSIEVSSGTALTKDLSDSPSFSDLLSSLSGIAIYGTISDILPITEKQLYDLSGTKLFMMGDIASLYDSKVSETGIGMDDNAAMSDDRISGMGINIEDNEVLSDIVISVSSFVRSISEGVSISESISKEPGKILSEAISFLESYIKDIGKGEYETLSITETINKDIAKPIIEALAIVDLYLFYRQIFTELELSSELNTDIVLNVDD